MKKPPFPRSSSRRHFLQTSARLSALFATTRFPGIFAQGTPSQRVRIAVIGLNRGLAHLDSYVQLPDVEIVAVCDADERRIAAAIDRVFAKSGQRPAGVKEFRQVLERPDLDAVSLAMPNFWHAPATILACSAGKHVYVEKPGSHNAREAELIVAAARHHRRLVQMGNQRRSMPLFRQAIDELHAGVVGPLRSARCWYDADRTSIGRGKSTPIPAWLNYAQWQGPVPDRPYVDNLVHYNWHWRWHWGGGELANNGIHTLDLARWGLGVHRPKTVTCLGGRYHFNDDQETPDTLLAGYDFGTSSVTWDGSSCAPRKAEAHPLVTFYGDGGSVALGESQYTIVDLAGKTVRQMTGATDSLSHFSNFIQAIRGQATLNSEIEEGQRSTMLCHLGNLAWRTRAALAIDIATGKLQHATSEQQRLWSREYRRGWEPRV